MYHNERVKVTGAWYSHWCHALTDFPLYFCHIVSCVTNWNFIPIKNPYLFAHIYTYVHYFANTKSFYKNTKSFARCFNMQHKYVEQSSPTDNATGTICIQSYILRQQNYQARLCDNANHFGTTVYWFISHYYHTWIGSYMFLLMFYGWVGSEESEACVVEVWEM